MLEGAQPGQTGIGRGTYPERGAGAEAGCVGITLVLGGERVAKGQMAGRGTADVNLCQGPKGSLVL